MTFHVILTVLLFVPLISTERNTRHQKYTCLDYETCLKAHLSNPILKQTLNKRCYLDNISHTAQRIITYTNIPFIRNISYINDILKSINVKPRTDFVQLKFLFPYDPYELYRTTELKSNGSRLLFTLLEHPIQRFINFWESKQSFICSCHITCSSYKCSDSDELELVSSSISTSKQSHNIIDWSSTPQEYTNCNTCRVSTSTSTFVNTTTCSNPNDCNRVIVSLCVSDPNNCCRCSWSCEPCQPNDIYTYNTQYTDSQYLNNKVYRQLLKYTSTSTDFVKWVSSKYVMHRMYNVIPLHFGILPVVSYKKVDLT